MKPREISGDPKLTRTDNAASHMSFAGVIMLDFLVRRALCHFDMVGKTVRLLTWGIWGACDSQHHPCRGCACEKVEEGAVNVMTNVITLKDRQITLPPGTTRSLTYGNSFSLKSAMRENLGLSDVPSSKPVILQSIR